MEYLYLLLILFVLAGYLLGKKRRLDTFVYLFVALVIFLRFVSEKLFPFQGNQIMSLFLRSGSFLFVILFALFYSMRKVLNERLLHFIILSCLYVTIIGLFRTVAYQYMTLYTTLISFMFFMVLVMAMKDKLTLKIEDVVRFSVWIGVFQACFGILQYFAPPSLASLITLQRYSTTASGQVLVGFADIDVGTVVQGTLNRFNTFGNFQAYVLLLHFGYNILYKRDRSFKNVFIAILLAYSIFISGNRASVLSLLGGAAVLLFFYRRTLFFIFLGIFIPVFVSANIFIDKVIANSVQTTTNPLERLMSSFVIFKGGSNLQDTGSTLFYSYSLIPDFLNNFLFGGGRYFLQGYQFVGANSGVSIYDTTLMTLLTEFGLVGFSILLLPYIYLFLFVRRFRKRPQYPLFLGLIALFILQTFTDPGIFAEDATYLFGMLVIGFYVDFKTHKKQTQHQVLSGNTLPGVA